MCGKVSVRQVAGEPSPRAVVPEALNMEEETSFVVVDGVVVPESALLRGERTNPYGSVSGLDDEELADPRELERQVLLEQWWPVLALPVQGKAGGFRPELDENGVSWGAFATVDFERTMPEFDKARYKADKLREKLKDVIMMFETVARRLPKAKWLVLKYFRMGLLDEEHIASWDMWQLALLDQRIRKLRREIDALRKASREREKKRAKAMFGWC